MFHIIMILSGFSVRQEPLVPLVPDEPLVLHQPTLLSGFFRPEFPLAKKKSHR